MGCEKYSGWLTDAALDGLLSSKQGELFAHASECEACRKAYAQAKQLSTFVDAGVSALVSGEPSDQFTARLRSRIANERHANRAAWAWRIPFAATTAIVAAILVITLANWREHDGPRPQIVAIDLPASGPATPSVPGFTQKRVAHSSHLRQEVLGQPTLSTQSEILVPPGQLTLAMQFSDVTEKRRAGGKDRVSAQAEIEKPLEIKAIVIEPIGTPSPIQLSPFADPYGGL